MRAHDGLGTRERDCFSALLDLALLLAPWRDQACLVGGWAVYLLTELFGQGAQYPVPRHHGTIDVDIAIGWPEITEETARVVIEALRAAGYEHGVGGRWRRHAPSGDWYLIDLMALPPRDHPGGPIAVGGYEFLPLWNGEDAFVDATEIALEGTTLSGQSRTAILRVPCPPAMLAMKAKAMVQRARGHPERDAYDICALLRSYPGGPSALAAAAVPYGDMASDTADILDACFVSGDEGTAMVARFSQERGEDVERTATEARALCAAFVRAVREACGN